MSPLPAKKRKKKQPSQLKLTAESLTAEKQEKFDPFE
jgi:hypothetical protein